MESKLSSRSFEQWALTREPSHKGWLSLEAAIASLPPVHVWAKLAIIVQNDTFLTSVDGVGNNDIERGVYALAGENLHERPVTGNHPSYYLPKAVIALRVVLRAENIDDRVFRFCIERDKNNGTVLAIAEIDTN